MAGDLPVELVAQDDDVLAVARQAVLFRIPGIPDPRLRHEVEANLMNDRGGDSLAVRAEEDRRAEDSLKRVHQTAIL